MELSFNQILLDSYILVNTHGDNKVVGRVYEISANYIYFSFQSLFGLDTSVCGVYNHYNKIYGLEFLEEIFELENWEYDELSGEWIEPTNRQISIRKNTDGYSKPWRVHIDNSDMDSIGYMDFTYFHELQAYCNISGVKLQFRLGSVNYAWKHYQEQLMAKVESEKSQENINSEA